MSSRHPMMDICDYYSTLDVGYGAGIMPKSKMITVPLHPHCHCRYHPHYHKPKKKHIANPENHTMDKFSLRDQQRIAGSFDKLRQFKEGASLEGIFNSVRPHYPIKKYSDVFGYNSWMKKFSNKNLTDIELKATHEWTQNSADIKMTMWGLSTTHIHQANTLFNLFNKYTPNIKNGTKLYRGMSFTKEMYFAYGYAEIECGILHSPDDKAIVSFSTDKKVAYEYANNNRKYKVIYILDEEEKAFDISKISSNENEAENIITKNMWYNVEYVKIYKRGEELWKIIKLKPEKK